MSRAEKAADLNLQHLYAEIQRVDAMIRREVRRWQLAGQNPADDFRGLYLSDAQATALVKRPFGTSWGQTVQLPSEEARLYTEAVRAAEAQAKRYVQQARAKGLRLRLPYLASAFDVDRFALDTLLICLAPHLDLRYEGIYGYLQDDVTRTAPTVNLVLDLLAPPGASRLQRLVYFSEDAPLFHYRLLQYEAPANSTPTSLLSQRLNVDPALVAWLLGGYRPPPELQGKLTWGSAPHPHDALLTEAPDIGATADAAPLVIFYGPDLLAQRAAARLLAARLERPLFTLDLGAVLEDAAPPALVLRLALRDARLNGALLHVAGWDACLKDGRPPSALLAELYAHPDPIVVSGEARWQIGGMARHRPLLWQEFPLPGYTRRLKLWAHFVGEEGAEDAATLEALAGQFMLTTAQIRDAVATARDQAAARNAPLKGSDLFAAARAHSNPRLAHLAHQITPRYTWEDIILPQDRLELLREIVVTVRQRPKVLETWGVGRKLAAGHGITILFAGPPGTGKTMAAEVIAAELGLDLYKIDLSTIISKYIGETEKNLERIFNEAQRSNAILFFDEADAIFGKRSEVKDAHDRYANIEVSYLLQRMESYDGVTILATNLRANLDEAFTRRLQFAVDFPFPQEADRRRIWATLFPPEVPHDDDLDFGLLARRFKLAGGNIRNIIVAAAYLAAADERPVSMQHLLHATRRELQKIGRLVNEEDLQLSR
ncbi:MAG: ATP-binding protein [Anaerolineae bacterium]